MKSRLGSFLFVMGLLILIVFIGSDLAQNPQYILFFAGLFLIVWGVSWMLKGYKPPPAPDTHLGLFRRSSGKGKEQESPKKGK